MLRAGRPQQRQAYFRPYVRRGLERSFSQAVDLKRREIVQAMRRDQAQILECLSGIGLERGLSGAYRRPKRGMRRKPVKL